MDHEHVRIAILDAARTGYEYVPASRLGNGYWRLVRSPLYAMQVAAGDVIRVLDSVTGSFELVDRGGNVCVQFFLGAHESDDLQATTIIANSLEPEVSKLGGRVDGVTAGLVVLSIPSNAGFDNIERVLRNAEHRHAGAQWQYGNVYDPVTGTPLGWWE